MNRKYEFLFPFFCILIVLGILLFGLSCRRVGERKDGGLYKDSDSLECSYRLSMGAYATSMNKLLFAVKCNMGELLEGSWLAIYDEEQRIVTHLPCSTGDDPGSFAWVPGRNMFVLTHGDHISLFSSDDTSGNGYMGIPVQCPIGILYPYCSWNPAGDQLAVICLISKSGETLDRLGFYDLKSEKFIISEIESGFYRLLWHNNTTLHVFKDYTIFEVRLESGTPKLVRTIPVEDDVMYFDGIINDRVLVRTNQLLKLGNKTLIELDRIDGTQVILTQTFILVLIDSKSSTTLIVFDHKGHEVCRSNPKKIIDSVTIGKNSNTLYGLSDSMLLRITIENEKLNVEEVIDLSKGEKN